MSMDPGRVIRAATDAGLTAGEFAGPAALPDPMTVWKRFIGLGAQPAARIPDERFDELSDAWLELATANGTIGPDGRFLLSIDGGLPWLEVRAVGTPRIGALGPDDAGDPEFVAMSLDGRAWCAVTTEEHDTWIFAEPA